MSGDKAQNNAYKTTFSGRLKVICVLGYDNSDNTSVVKNVSDRLCYWKRHLVGESIFEGLWHTNKGMDCRILFSKNKNDTISNGLEIVAKRNWGGCSKDRFDCAVITLSRSDGARKWMSSIKRSIMKLRKNTPAAFDEFDLYFVHSLLPRVYTGGSLTGDVANCSTLIIPPIGDLTDMCENEVIELLSKVC